MRVTAGVKIYIVALCWVGVTLVLPVVNAHILGARFLSKMCSTFYIGFVLILIFEILTWLMTILTYIQCPTNRSEQDKNCWFVIVASILFFRIFQN
jgi:hypothetical protein